MISNLISFFVVGKLDSPLLYAIKFKELLSLMLCDFFASLCLKCLSIILYSRIKLPITLSLCFNGTLFYLIIFGPAKAVSISSWCYLFLRLNISKRLYEQLLQQEIKKQKLFSIKLLWVGRKRKKNIYCNST